MEDGGWLLKQWLATILLGAVNIEQTKLLDFRGLAMLLGKTLRSLRLHRLQLTELASTETVHQLLRSNGDEVDLEVCNDFYYDPHNKHYTGVQNVLKGWCAAIRGVGKTLYMDFIYTASGHPVCVQHTDIYEDLRARFYQIAEQFRSVVGIVEERVLTFVLDRGIYSHDVFEQIIKSESYHPITWQKGYKPALWSEQQLTGSFIFQRPRNSSTDPRTYRFEYIDGPWPPVCACLCRARQTGATHRQARRAHATTARASLSDLYALRAGSTNPHGRTVQLAVLTDDSNRKAEEIITLIFNRWIQENDFKYLESHSGINEITSYTSTAYSRLKDSLEERQMKNSEYKALAYGSERADA